MRYLSLFLVLALIFAFGCGSMVQEGRKIDAMKVKQLAAGQTNAANVQEVFGKPDKVEKLSSGEDNYIYEYHQNKPHWWTIDTSFGQKLEVTIKDEIVQTYKFTEQGKEWAQKEKSD